MTGPSSTESPNAPLPSRAERRLVGEAARQRVPPEAHATWSPADDRPDIVALLREQAATRIPELVPIRHGRMAVSPLTFYRGAALPMASDLAGSPDSGIRVQLGGDAHLSNFGLFASPERTLMFDMNDFDETLPGPWEWDVKRLAGSLVVAANVLGSVGHEAHHTAVEAVRSYQQHMAEYATMRVIDTYYAHVDAQAIIDGATSQARSFVASTVKSAAHHDAIHELPRLTAVGTDGRRRIVDQPPTTFHDARVDVEAVAVGLRGYASSLQEDRRTLLGRYQLVDAAVKVVGVGSVGLAATVVLLDSGDPDDPLFLQAKEAEASVLERFLGTSALPHHGERVVAGQRRLQAAHDVLLGWTTGPNHRDMYVRQLQDQKAGAVIDTMTLADLTDWGVLCGWALARGHARSGDAAAIAGYLGADHAFAHAIGDFATRYAQQTDRDHATLLAAVKDGRLDAQRGV